MDSESSILHQYIRPIFFDFFQRIKISLTEFLLGTAVIIAVTFVAWSKYTSSGQEKDRAVFEAGLKDITAQLAVESLNMEQSGKPLGVFNPFQSGELAQLNYDGARYWVNSENVLEGTWIWQTHPRYPRVFYIPKHRIKTGWFQAGQYWYSREVIPRRNPGGRVISIALGDS